MNRRRPPGWFCAAVAVALGCQVLAADTAPRPNIVFILLDNCGQEWLGGYGSEEGCTPHMDRLAREGVRFTHCYASPVCGPSRTMLLTGRYPFRTGFTLHHDAALYGGGGLDPKREIVWPRVLREAGYATGIVGKWQVNQLSAEPGVLRRHGFDEHVVWPGEVDRDKVAPADYEKFLAAVRDDSAEGTAPFVSQIESRYWDPVLLRDGRRERLTGRFGPDVMQEAALDFVRRHRERPFLLYYPMVLTHGRTFTEPAVPTPLNMDPNRPHQAMYADMVRYADQLVGRFVESLDALGLRERTIVFVATDNGTEKSLVARRNGRKVVGGLYTLTEAGGDVALMANSPKLIPGGRTVALADFTDIYPTVCDLAGVPRPKNVVLDGRSHASLLRGEPGAKPAREWIANQYHTTRVVRDARHKLYSTGEFYDAQADPDEKADLASSADPRHAAARERLAAVLRSLPPDSPPPFKLLSQSAFKLRRKAAGPVWIHAAQPRAMSPLMTTASHVALPEGDAMGDFILSAVTATAETGAPESWAEFTMEVPKDGVYRLWGRVRFPAGAGESFCVAPSSGGGEFILDAGKDARRWHWVDCGKLKLPAGPWTFRVHPHRAAATTFGPLKWRKAELTQTPRLNVLCLSADLRYMPTDADAQKALGLTKTKPSSPGVVPAKLSPLPADGPLVENRRRVPDWMRVPRWFTKDSWRDELKHRRAGDIAALVREVAANGGQALRLSVFWGGEAYYQSRVAPHVPGLGKLDYLREAMEEAARTGAKVIVYMNPNALVGEHPLRAECAIREADGRMSEQPAYGRQAFPNGSRYACVNHPRYRQFLRDVLTEIFGRYKAHGLYVDGLTPHVCFCEHCRAKWRAMFGSEMPVEKLGKNPPGWAVWGEFGRDPQPVGDVENDPDARRWTEMMLRSLVEVTHEFSVTVKKAKPDAVTTFHSHPKAGSEDDYDGTLTEVYTPRPWVHIAWRSGELAGYSAVYHVPTLFNIYPHRHFTAAEARYHALQGLAAGAYPNFWSALGMKPVAGFMARCADCLDFATAAPVKFIALPRDLRESDTQRKTPRAAGVSYAPRDRFLAPYVGAYSALMRSGLPVVTLHRPRFEESIAGFKVLVLANVALLSGAQAEAVRRFVRDGGGLVATHETSLYDEKGQRRQDFALADVLGVRYKATLKPQGEDEPRVFAEPAGAETVDWPSDAGGVFAHRFGKGRVVYLPGRPDSAQCYNPSAQTERLFAKAVRWVSQDNVPVEIEAAGTVGVTLFRQPRRLIVHLVNHQRDSLFNSDAVEPVGKLSLRVTVPMDCRVQRVRRLWEDRDLPFEVKDHIVRVEVGRLDEYEAVAVEW